MKKYKQYLVSDEDAYERFDEDGYLCDVFLANEAIELPPNGKWLTREDLLDVFGWCQSEALDELFGVEK